ncbi:phytoene/squalene synthase family protein [Streptomyces sp. NPDC090022]|uniref:phytoene/squalene synthase family protein n=1 Tax=Streptomyces sp. NPDC090022 TaxID=3365920 RepID=UPI0037F5F29C
MTCPGPRSGRELDAAGITDPVLRAAYGRCRELNAAHGKTYFLATRLLPIERRPAVHALYGFARWADDIVDATGADAGADADDADDGPRGARLAALQQRLDEGLRHGDRGEPVVAALADTAHRYAIDHRHFQDFMTAMRSDLVVTDYPTYADLRGYMHGSAAVIGLQMLPVLGTVVPREEAEPYAAALGVAFQLTNFLRDVGEDLDRGRVYLPADLLAGHGVGRDLLHWCRSTGRQDRRVLGALREFEALTRGVYREARPGLALLDPLARPCIRTAFVLYGSILNAVASDGYAVLHRRSVVPRRRRAAVAAVALARLTAVRLRHRRRAAPMPTPAPAPAPAPPADPTADPDRPVPEEAV